MASLHSDQDLYRHVAGIMSSLHGVAVLTEETVVEALLRAHVKYQRNKKVCRAARAAGVLAAYVGGARRVRCGGRWRV